MSTFLNTYELLPRNMVKDNAAITTIFRAGADAPPRRAARKSEIL